MRPATVLIAALAALSAPAVARAQHPWEPAATVEQAIARAVADAMPDVRYPHRLEWSNFGVRGGRDIFWHLAPPVPRWLNPPPQGMHRRTGWLHVTGRSGDVVVCGIDDRIGGMAISVSDIWLDRSDVIRELTDRGVTATLIESRETSLGEPASDDWLGDGSYTARVTRYPAHRRWSLEREGHEPVQLTADYRCTPPGARSATSCQMTWSVLFRPDEPLAGLDQCTDAHRDFF